MPLYVLGLNHQTAPVALRERATVPESQQAQALNELLQQTDVMQAVWLNTCNRSEIYCQIAEEKTGELAQWLADYHGIEASKLNEHLYHHRDRDAVTHLFRVASGLDSMIIGEPQILGQVKAAFALAREHKTASGALDRLFQHSFAVAKRVRTETRIGSQPVSVAYASVKLARQHFSQLEQSCVMLIGAGETTDLVAQHLANANVKRLLIANRTLENAQVLASRYGGFALPLSEAPKHYAEADIVISATASAHAVVFTADIAAAIRQRRHKPMLLIDLAVPRDIEPGVAELTDVYAYSVDDLDAVLEESRSFRQQAAQEAEHQITQYAGQFAAEMNALDHQSSLLRLRARMQDARSQLLEKARLSLARGEPAEDVMETLANQLGNKMLHAPTLVMKQAALDGDIELLRAAERLFQLDADAES
jgi:glutamyl-tRNA reductase